jgi:type IV pilus assembly protein PilA
MSTFCRHCGNSINDEDTFCPSCGAAAGTRGPATSEAAAGPAKTSAKAIISLVCGLFIFFFPLSIVAIILGHLSHSKIKKSAGRLAGEGLATAGLVLGYMGVAAVPLILIIAAIAIPNLLRARMAANESSALASVRTIAVAEVSYAAAHPEAGFTCSLSELSSSQSIDRILAGGEKHGYRFEIMGCEAEAPGGANTRYKIVAYPIVANQTGIHAFCSDESAVIRQHSGGSAQSCVEEGVVLK